MTTPATRSRGHRATIWLVAAFTVTALGVRVWDLGSLSISHPEAYAPGIGYPPDATQPIERRSLEAIVRSSFLTDNHPPGYYLLLLPWSRWVGADIGSLRLPSALFGALTIPLLFLAARRLERTPVAVLAAAWLALHGTHVLWSRSARMWTLCALAAVASTWALTRLSRRSTLMWEALYVGSVTVGLWSDYTFWPLLATQMLYVLATGARQETMPRTLGLQAITIVLGSPVFMFLMSRLGSSAYLEAPVSSQLSFFLAFDAWFDEEIVATLGASARAALWILPALGAALVGLGLWRGPERRLLSGDNPRAPHAAVWLSLLWPIALVAAWRDQPFDRAFPVREVTLAVPLVVAATYSLAARYWRPVRRVTSVLLDRGPAQRWLTDLFLVQAVMPFAVLLAASLVMPAVAPRTVLYLAPFMLVLASRGVVSLAPTMRAQVAAAGVVTAGGALSTYLALTAPPVRDYQALAAAIDGARRNGDVVMIENNWYAQPLHYYLPPGRVPTVTSTALADPSALDAVDRLWVVVFPSATPEAVWQSALGLPGFRRDSQVDASAGTATLFVRQP